MNYYTLSNSNENDIGSQYPQIQKMGGTMHRDAPDSIYNIPSGKFPNFKPNLDFLVLHPKAKLTDFISAVQISNGFIVSGKVKNILSKFNIIDHNFYSATIKHNGSLYTDYFWFCPVGNVNNFIDYAKTEFYIIDSFGEKENVQINSYEELMGLFEKTSSLKKIRTTKIKYLKINVLDLFYLHSPDRRTFISESLNSEFIKQKITGITITKSSIV